MLLNNSSYWDWWPYILEVGNEQDKGDIMATFGLDSVAVSVFVVILLSLTEANLNVPTDGDQAPAVYRKIPVYRD